MATTCPLSARFSWPWRVGSHFGPPRACLGVPGVSRGAPGGFRRVFSRSPGPIFGSGLVPGMVFFGSPRRSKSVFGFFSCKLSFTLGISGCAKEYDAIFGTISASTCDGVFASLHIVTVQGVRQDVTRRSEPFLPPLSRGSSLCAALRTVPPRARFLSRGRRTWPQASGIRRPLSRCAGLWGGMLRG